MPTREFANSIPLPKGTLFFKVPVPSFLIGLSARPGSGNTSRPVHDAGRCEPNFNACIVREHRQTRSIEAQRTTTKSQ
jgi:hypothetical protein